MFKSKSWFFSSSSSTSGTLWKPKNPHSIDYLKFLHQTLVKNQSVTDQNKGLLVEALRSIAEILIWGDQNDPAVFDFFLEKNMLSYFLKIMRQKCGSNYVCVQLLQTLNILFENIRNQTSIYYLLSNNHVNSIIEHKFDFSDEEVMAYYISFLKTLSLKLNSQTIHFFYNEHTHDFPLYTEAIKFFNNSESMVRIAVRTLTLNVFRITDASMQRFIRDKTAAPYFSNLVWFIGNHVIEVDKLIKEGGLQESKQKYNRLDDLIAEHLDHLHYINDILLLGISELNAVLVDHLLNRLLRPIVFPSLFIPSPTPEPDTNTYQPQRISRILSLYLVTQLLSIVTHKELLLQLLDAVEMDVVISLVDTSETDYLAFYAISLLLSMQKVSETYSYPSALFPTPSYNQSLVTALLKVISASVRSTAIRIATVGMAADLMKKIIVAINDGDLALLESHREENMATLKDSMATEEFFLELFEDEYKNRNTGLGFETLLGDSSMLLPPVASPLSGIGLEKRRPCGESERTRRAMRLYFILRELSLKLRKEDERQLPLYTGHRNSTPVHVEQSLDLTNSDLLACTLVTQSEPVKLRRFLVVDSFQFILVEPSPKRMGWGVVKFVAFLQDIDVKSDSSDSRSLLVSIETKKFAAKFIFDDHIRCMAARQRLVKGRQKAREKKLNLIQRLLLHDNHCQKYSPPENMKSGRGRKFPGTIRAVTVPTALPTSMNVSSSQIPMNTLSNSDSMHDGLADTSFINAEGIYHV